MTDEHESAAAAWLDLPETRREMQIIQARYPKWSSYEVAQFVLSMEMLVALEVYGTDEPPPTDPPDEPWRPRLA